MSKKKLSPQKRDKLDRDKRLLMGAGIVFFMSLIGFLWVFNIQTVFEKRDLQKDQEQEKIAEFREEFSDTIDNIRQEVKSFKTVASSTVSDSEKISNNSSQSDQQERRRLDSIVESLRQDLEKEFK